MFIKENSKSKGSSSGSWGRWWSNGRVSRGGRWRRGGEGGGSSDHLHRYYFPLHVGGREYVPVRRALGLAQLPVSRLRNHGHNRIGRLLPWKERRHTRDRDPNLSFWESPVSTWQSGWSSSPCASLSFPKRLLASSSSGLKR